MFIKPEDIVDRLFLFGNPDSCELIGENGKFGRLLFKRGASTKIVNILIHNEEVIMDAVEEGLCRFSEIWHKMYSDNWISE